MQMKIENISLHHQNIISAANVCQINSCKGTSSSLLSIGKSVQVKNPVEYNMGAHPCNTPLPPHFSNVF